MNTKFKIIISLMICVISLYVVPVKANTGENPYQVYLPLISYDTYVDPWIGPYGGKVVCMAANPNNPDEIYAGTWGNGVYKSYDGGLHWTSSNRGLGDGNINSIAIDPQNPKIVYAGTYNDELYKTTNGGESWYKSSQGVRDGDIIYTIGIDPHNPDIIFIGTRNGELNKPPWEGTLYRSVNEGITWTPVLTNVGGSDVQDWPYDVLVNPKDHKMVFAAYHEHGVYRSLDSGDHWEAVNGTSLKDLSARALVINPKESSSNLLSVGLWHHAGTFKSTNNGDSWVERFVDVKVYTMDIDPQDPANLYLVNYLGGVYKSSNAGDSWKYSGLGEYKMYTVMVNPARHNQVLAGTTENGVFRSEDYGAHWVASSNGLINTDVVGFAVLPEEADHYLAVTALGGFYTTVDGGETWDEVSKTLNGIELTDLYLNPVNPDQVVILSKNQGLWTCLLPECDLRQMNTGLPMIKKDSRQLIPRDELEAELMLLDETYFESHQMSGNLLSFNKLTFSDQNQQFFYLATKGNGVYRSVDNIENWQPAGLAEMSIVDLVVNPANEAVLYAADADNPLIYTSTNYGENWTQTKMPAGKVYALATTAQEPCVLYAGTDNGVYKRAEDGQWEAIGLDGVVVTNLEVHPMQPGLLVAAAQDSVYYSKNGGISWTEGPEVFLSTNINAIHFDENDPTIVFLSTNSKGVYRLKIN